MTPNRNDAQGQPEVVHLCPPVGSHELPCCGQPPISVPLWHVLTRNPDRVTCTGKSSTRGSEAR